MLRRLIQAGPGPTPARSLGAALLFSFLAPSASSPAAETSAAGTTLGPLTVQPCVTVYLPVGAEAEKVRLTIRRGARLEGDRLMVRALDPAGKLTFWQYLQPDQMKSPYGPGDSEMWGIPLSYQVNPRPGDLFLDTDLSLSGPGTHEIRLAAGAANSVASLDLPASSAYGLSFQNGTYTSWPGQPRTMYVYVPPRAEELEIEGGPVRIFDDKGIQVLATDDSSLQNSHQKIKLGAAAAGTVWRVEFPQPAQWKLRAAGFPFILCSDAAAARLIHASIDQLPDGSVVAFPFQQRIAALLPRVLAPENVGRTDPLLTPLASRREAWMQDPERNAWLLRTPGSPFLSIDWTLRHQNLDPSSYWGGAVAWEETAARPAPENRWDRLQSVMNLFAGAEPQNSAMEENLALAALLDAPFNPYYGKKELLYRAAAIALRDLMTLKESEIWSGYPSDLDAYPGSMAFSVGQKTFPVYALAAPHLPAEIRDLWTEGLRHIVDRSYPDMLVTCRNQSSHYLVAYEDFAEGSGDPRYLALARLYAQRFADGQDPAGYFMEECGPDASYIGMTHWHMAVYYQQSKDPVILAAIKKSYDFFNHTVAPEPDGSMLGGFNFNHRVGDGFFNEQWSGAKGILDGVLPEVGLWARSKNWRDQLAAGPAQLAKMLDQEAPEEKTPNLLRNIDTPRYLYWHAPDTTGTWPARETESFTRNFADELVAVKRPGYYAAIFVGKPAPTPFYIAKREQFRDPLPGDAENTGGAGADHPGGVSGRFITPFLGGGLSLFWTPAYGSSVLATNWSPLTHHGLVATTLAGKRYWEDYFATAFTLSPDRSSLSVTGKVEGVPLKYERRYRFDDQEMGVDLVLTAIQDVQLGRLIENIPVAEGPVKADGATLEAGGEQGGAARASRLTVHDAKGNGLEIVFDQPRDLTLQRNGLQRKGLQVGRVEVALPATIKAGDSVELKYVLHAWSHS